MTKKRGKLSIEELQYIDANTGIVPLDKMALELNRSEDVIAKHIEEIRDKKNSTLQRLSEKDSAHDLRAKPIWLELKQQYNDKELELYLYHWVKYINQFDGNVTHSEEGQICKAIDLEILMHRCLKEKYALYEETSILEKNLAREMNADDALKDNNLIAQLMAQVQGYRASQQSKTKEYNELLDKCQKMSRDLKTTRDQRFKEIQDRKITYFGWLKTFQDNVQRKKMSKEAALIAKAMEKSTTDMAEYHKYNDGVVDQPILSSETLKEDNV